MTASVVRNVQPKSYRKKPAGGVLRERGPLFQDDRVQHNQLNTVTTLPGGNCAVIFIGALKRKQPNRWSRSSERTLNGFCTLVKRHSWLE